MSIFIPPSGEDHVSAGPERRAALRQSLQFVDAQLRQLHAQAAVLDTARQAYARELAALDAAAPGGAAAAMPAPPVPVPVPTDGTRVLLVTYGWSTLTEMACLAKQAGCQVDVLCPHYNKAIKNSYHDRWLDSGPSMDTLLEALGKLAHDRSYRYILIGDDPILWRIYRERISALWPLLPILNPDAQAIFGKVAFAVHCRDHAISSPQFRAVGQVAEAQPALQALGLPLVVKENYSNGGAGVHIFQDAASYAAFMAAYDYREPLLVQQFINGELLGIDALFKRGKLLQYANAVDVEPSLGPSTKRRYFPNDEQIGDLLRQLGQSAILHGFANVSVLRDIATRRCYLIEADPRPTKWVASAKWFGHDFVPALRVFLADGEADGGVPEARYQDVDCWEVEHFPTHLVKLLSEGRTAEAILHLLDFKRNVRHTVYDPVLLEEKMDTIRTGMQIS